MGAIYLGFEVIRWTFTVIGVLVCAGLIFVVIWGWPKLMKAWEEMDE